MTTEAETAILEIRCPYCGASPGEWCFTSSGFRSSYLHSGRFYTWRDEADNRAEWPPIR